MSFPVLKGAGYVLVHTPDMIVQNGSTCGTERVVNPDSEFLKKINDHIRSYDEVVNYLPNQAYIGNIHPKELKEIGQPFYEKEEKDRSRDGKYGDIAPQDEFIALMQICDAFELVYLAEDFVEEIKPVIEEKYPEVQEFMNRLKGSDIASKASELIEEHKAEGLYHDGELCGYVKQAHDIDVNLNAHTMFENLVVKTSGVMAAIQLLRKNDIDPLSIDYVIECSEEACGDVNQRGGGNFAKSIAEMIGIKNATGSDTRSFCAAPTHSLIEAAAMVKAGVHKNVLVVAGGSTAKLGMNAKDHVKKDLPVLEDVVAGFAVLVSENDGEHPVLRTDLTGQHNVATGSSPQAVMSSLISEPLEKGGLKITDVDSYSVEMQNPDITKPAGAGDVPEANFKMIGALAVMKGHIERTDLPKFVENGLPGWAPTQGHIPSGVPYCGFCIDDLTKGDQERAMIVGKGSLFLGRMTNLFDGVSIIVERNTGELEEETAGSNEEIKKVIAEAMRNIAENMMEE
ncbi:MAG: glycine/sarcosine/betaine reductase complex component C subunit beta [Tissierellia bacterium]|nr:glycine/sarcosine/betaine reductase complex component C subunit beta [Tissierellia bacterium]